MPGLGVGRTLLSMNTWVVPWTILNENFGLRHPGDMHRIDVSDSLPLLHRKL